MFSKIKTYFIMFTFKQKIKPLKKFQKENQKFIVYKHTNKINGKCYVGKAINSWEYRWKNHLYDSKCGSELYFHRAIRKYGYEEWTHEILEELETELFCLASEMYWINFFDSANPVLGYNMTLGGEGVRPNDETKLKMSISHKGKPLSKEHSQNIGLAQIGKKHSKESKEKMGRSGEEHHFYGKKHSEETIIKMSISHKGKPSPTKGKVPWNKGKKTQEKTLQKLRIIRKGKTPPNKGKKMTQEELIHYTQSRRHNKEIKELGQVLLGFYQIGDLWNY